MKEQRTETVRVRFTKSERRELTIAAKALEQSLSDYIRGCIFGDDPEDATKPGEAVVGVLDIDDAGNSKVTLSLPAPKRPWMCGCGRRVFKDQCECGAKRP